MTAPDRPEWLVPGTEVVVFPTGGTTIPNDTRKSTIERVAAKTFTVTHYPNRFTIATQTSREGSGVWAKTICVVPADSERGRVELAALARRRRYARAYRACRVWMADDTPTNRAAAIAALRALGEEDVS